MIRPREVSQEELQEFFSAAKSTLELARQEQADMTALAILKSPALGGLERTLLHHAEGREVPLSCIVATSMLAGFLLGRSFELGLMRDSVREEATSDSKTE